MHSARKGHIFSCGLEFKNCLEEQLRIFELIYRLRKYTSLRFSSFLNKSLHKTMIKRKRLENYILVHFVLEPSCVHASLSSKVPTEIQL